MVSRGAARSPLVTPLQTTGLIRNNFSAAVKNFTKKTFFLSCVCVVHSTVIWWWIGVAGRTLTPGPVYNYRRQTCFVICPNSTLKNTACVLMSIVAVFCRSTFSASEDCPVQCLPWYSSLGCYSPLVWNYLSHFQSIPDSGYCRSFHVQTSSANCE